jgi:hypothetical protein
VLLETFHRWAVAEGLVVAVVAGLAVASASFADDVVLVTPSELQLESPIAA